MTGPEKPWLNKYELGPYKLKHSLIPYPKVPSSEALDRTAAKYPARTAILYEGRATRYRDLKDQVDRLAAAMAALGVVKGDRICLFLPNCVEFILCYWAILKAGGVVVPTSILQTEEGLIHESGIGGLPFDRVQGRKSGPGSRR